MDKSDLLKEPKPSISSLCFLEMSHFLQEDAQLENKLKRTPVKNNIRKSVGIQLFC